MVRKLGLLLGGFIVACLLAEGWLALTARHDGLGSARELTQFRKDAELAGLFCIDPDFGFRPVLGSDAYTTYGTRPHRYAFAKPEHVTRLLFVGDSVTYRGRIIEALRRHYGDARYEYWNAGVESFNTVQEAAFYRRYNAALAPDHVILTFHLNDFETTPVAFRGSDDGMVVYAPNVPRHALHPWWFRHSRLYRLLAGMMRHNDQNIDAVMDETRRALTDWRDLLAREDRRFTVVVMPFLSPYDEWLPGDRFAHRAILQMLHELEIRHMDLLPVSEAALAEGVNLCEAPGDDWHPNDAAAMRFATFLAAQGLLDDR